MNILVVLFPLALGMGLAGLGAFFWCMRTGQYADIEGSAWRVLQDDDLGLEADVLEDLLDETPSPSPAVERSARSLTQGAI
ncbi:MAG: cbb3-type cytochrome oxidase assembly protein CcoS [Bosea sp. (in: a-proteobacteria)]|uniref:cbb3-type cytochrome oxidase assembly protein CcoS n=1 Tax=Bosea sp. (in: a-proteobacteria) TaxID=1871050 RepID=UPI00273564EF|nr:cbb3-type cytochrome oxidase assembly protein CcoS [Bosea sp. (in: a-proteobacteria)]MDP3255205.1 cbb3-type cytochrome oxidase assembly protein CcoS [Bosea sp. (in: a-proteobacteria)]MDP3319684.1 cbb3-type cytochrome oxidase assembly protein CcoS [Bosea sp. (in: a-proteobacteria)]